MSSDCGLSCCTGGTCVTETPTCQGQGYQCCEACSLEPQPELDGDCPSQVCCGFCLVEGSEPAADPDPADDLVPPDAADDAAGGDAEVAGDAAESSDAPGADSPDGEEGKSGCGCAMLR